MNPAAILDAAGLTIVETMTTPSRPGKKPRPVWEVRGNVGPWEPLFRGLGGRPWRGAFSFFEDPAEAIADAIQNENADAQLSGTYRERRESRAERLREWSDKRKTKSAAAFKSARVIADGIPLGQPILVGHHSEKRHRRDVARIENGMRKGIEHEQKAHDMESRAANIEAAAERAIYSDDVDAVDRLRAKLAGMEAERERVKAVNKAVRKHGLQRLIEPAPPFELTDAEKHELLTLLRVVPYHQPEKRGFPPYHLQNLGGNITRTRQRLEQLEAKAAARARVRAALAAEAVDFAPAEPLVISYGSTVIHRTAPEADDRPAPVSELADEIAEAERNAGELAEVPFSLTPTHERRTPKTGGLF